MKEDFFNSLPWMEKTILEVQICSHCGHELYEYRYIIHRSHANFMLALYKAGKPILKREVDEGICSRDNFTYGTQSWRWGLVRSLSYSNRGPWELTQSGFQFLEDKLLIPKYAVTFKKSRSTSKVIRYEGPALNLQKVLSIKKGEEMYSECKEDRLSSVIKVI